MSRLAGLLLLLLEDVVGGVKDGLHRLAVVLLLAVAEVQGALAAQLQFVRIIVMKVVKKKERKAKKSRGYKWRHQPPSSCRSCFQEADRDRELA